MITRPLDLASKLRPEPRNFDFLFYVNAGLIALCFSVLGSRFVLAPGLGLDFQLAKMPGARGAAAPTTHRITVKPNGLIFIEDGSADPKRLADWLAVEARKTREPVLLIIASKDVPNGTIVEIANVAHGAGFQVQQAAEEPASTPH